MDANDVVQVGTRDGAERGYGIAPPGYRLPETTRLGPVHLQVSSLEQSLPFYRDVLGFRVINRGDERVSLHVRGNDAPLIELHERPGAAPMPRRGRLGLYHVAVLLPDRAALGRFAAHLDALGIRPGAADHLVSEALYLHDPDGLGIEVYADRPRTAWHSSGRELVMDTKSLDTAALARAAADLPWTGLPDGTTIGHVHLHVGALREAAAFFHEALGFDITVQRYPGALFLAAGGYHHHLGLNTWAGPDAQRPDADDARLLEWSIHVPHRRDAEAAAHSMQAAGFDVSQTGYDWRVEDPWGTLLRIHAANDAQMR